MDVNINMGCDALAAGSGGNGNGRKKSNDGGEGSRGLRGLENPDSVICSICLDQIFDNGTRAWAKLRCGHFFHLDCIGSTFNFEDAMKCPNCREVEQGDWRQATGYQSSDEDLIDEVPINNVLDPFIPVTDNQNLAENEALQTFLATNALQPPLANEPPHQFQDAQQMPLPQQWLGRAGYENNSDFGYAHPYLQAARSSLPHNQTEHGRAQLYVPVSMFPLPPPIQAVHPVAQALDAAANEIDASQEVLNPTPLRSYMMRFPGHFNQIDASQEVLHLTPLQSYMVGFTDRMLLERIVSNHRNSLPVAGDTNLNRIPVNQSHNSGRNMRTTPQTSETTAVVSNAAEDTSEPNVVDVDYLFRILEGQGQDETDPTENTTERQGSNP